MTTGYQIKEQDQLYYITLQVVDWIDIFTKEVYRKIIIENLVYCQKHKGLEIYGWGKHEQPSSSTIKKSKRRLK